MDATYHLIQQHQQQQLQQQQQQQQQQQLYNYPQQQISVSIDAGADRFPQWSIQETRDFLVIRADLDQKFMETKRNKLLWELISTKMNELGYNRSPDQCKCKWKNLVTRYKGCETIGSEEMKLQFPFYGELQSIFGARMQMMLWMETEDGSSGSKKKVTQLSSDEDDENEESDLGDKKAGKSKKKRKAKCISSTPTTSNSNVKEILDDIMRQQKEMEMQWMRAMEAREEERKMRELEWRQRMEALETERMMMQRQWREREEEWRVRDEVRAQKRDALIDALLNKLAREDRA